MAHSGRAGVRITTTRRIGSSTDGKPLPLGIPDYHAAGYMLVADTIFGALVYGQQEYLAHPYVKGVGGNALYDFDWMKARILKH